ncbi:MAG TPA: metallophosphoesterase [Bacteroidales bacterium]|nr:MAG: metallophosphoesterase [Bacteroidetes bacterium GWE2_42_24]HAQ65946.1 metallophosphoesterase [Bacteroidales bacterium]HBZ66962.1 metallophosphoesterase [Bacteroidales bacterium]
MKSYQLLVFFSVILTVYALLNWLLFSNGLQVFPQGTRARIWFIWVFWLLVSAYPMARVLERVWLSPVSDLLTWIGSFWLAAFFYFLLALLVVDLFRLVNWVFPFFHLLAGGDPSKARLVIFLITTGAVAIVLIVGHVNAVRTKVTHYNLYINKPVESIDKLRIVAASDIHLGTVIGPRRLGRLVKLIDEQKPDVVLFAGDVVDEDLAPVVRNDLGKLLLKITAPMGVYAITGNHEYIGGAASAVKYLSDHGIQMVRDTSVLVGNSIILIGREDRDRGRFSGMERKSMGTLLTGIDLSRPVIMLDHQPFNLQEAVDAGIDVQISGHTHHGQIWPMNYITRAIFELSSGYLQKGKSHFIVSTGYGSWGPPVRTGNRPEIIVVDLTFAK